MAGSDSARAGFGSTGAVALEYASGWSKVEIGASARALFLKSSFICVKSKLSRCVSCGAPTLEELSIFLGISKARALEGRSMDGVPMLHAGVSFAAAARGCTIGSVAIEARGSGTLNAEGEGAIAVALGDALVSRANTKSQREQ